MEKWILFALLSTLFAGFTSVIAKIGLQGISGELGLSVRTIFVFGFVLIFACAVLPRGAMGTLTRHNLIWLSLSGLTTALSWIFYYQALKEGDVATVALIDKGSILVAIVLAAVLLKETITLRTLTGAALILSGMIVVARK